MKIPMAVAAALLVLAMPAAAVAQDAAALDRTLQRIAGAWSGGDAAGIAAFASSGGVSVELEGESAGTLSARKLGAILRRSFERRETRSVRTGMSQVVGGRPPRAFGELTWVSIPEGTRAVHTRTVFFALVEERGAWRLTQIRILQ